MFRKKKKKSKEHQNSETLGLRGDLSILDLVVPGGTYTGFDAINVDGRLVRVYALVGLPRLVTPGFLDELLALGDVDISVQYYPARDELVIRELIQRETKARALYEIDLRAGAIGRLPELEQEIADYRALREAVQLGQDRLYHVSIFVGVWGDDEQTLRKKCGAIEAACARKGMVLKLLYTRQEEGFVSAMPTATLTVQDTARNMTTGAAMCCVPFTAAGAGSAVGTTVGWNYYTGSPVRLPRFEGEHIVSNPHLFVAGETGAGKSVTLRYIALVEALTKGVRTAFLDPEGEYEAFVAELGGQVVRLRSGTPSGINPLDVDIETEDDGTRHVPIASKVEDVSALLRAVYIYHTGRAFSAEEAGLLERAVIRAYAARGITSNPESLYEGGIKKQMPTISDVYTELHISGADSLCAAMQPLLADGSLGFFDCQTTISIQDTPFLCVSLRGLEGDYPRFIGVLGALAWLWQAWSLPGGKSRPKAVAVDEAWMFLRYGDVAKHLEILARRGRKHGCGLTIATQRFEEFTNSEAGRAVVDSCASVLVLRQEEHAVDAVITYLKLAEGSRDVLAGAAPGRGILRTAGTTVAVQIAPAPHEMGLVETRIGMTGGVENA